MPAYAGTPAAGVRAMLADESRPSLGDPVKMARLIIGSVDITPAPKRLVLGSDSYGIVVDALRERLADVEHQQEQAGSTDIAS